MKKHPIRSIIIFALIFLIIPVALFINKINDRHGSVETPEEKEDVIVPLSRSNLEHSIVDQAFLDSINNAWYKKIKRRINLVDSVYDFSRSPKNGAEYLGTYNGYIIISANPMLYSISNNEIILANHNFIASAVLGYKEGVLYEAAELYENGELLYSDISAMHDRLCEAYYYSEYYRTLGDISVIVPGVQTLDFPSNTEPLIKEAIASKFLLKESAEASGDDVILTNNYGRYGETVFFTYKSPLKYYIQNMRYEEVGGEMFVYQNGNRIYGYNSTGIYTLTEAYEAGLIEEADLKYIKEYHNAYYPFAVDEYGTVALASPIDQYE